MATRRVTMREAAEILGVSKEAVRKRVIRGTLRSDKGEDGRRYVYIDAGGDDVGDEAPTGAPDALMSEMRARIQFLEEEHRRKDAILLNMTEAMKALSPPPQEARESSVSPAPVRTPTEAHREAQEGVQQPWRRRFRRFLGLRDS